MFFDMGIIAQRREGLVVTRLYRLGLLECRPDSAVQIVGEGVNAGHLNPAGFGIVSYHGRTGQRSERCLRDTLALENSLRLEILLLFRLMSFGVSDRDYALSKILLGIPKSLRIALIVHGVRSLLP